MPTTTYRELMERYWASAETNDVDAMHNIRDEAFIVDFPQTGERLAGRDVVRAFEEGHSTGGTFELDRLTGEGNVWVAEGRMRSSAGVMHVVSINELENGRIARSIGYFASPLPPMVSSAPAESSHQIEP